MPPYYSVKYASRMRYLARAWISHSPTAAEAYETDLLHPHNPPPLEVCGKSRLGPVFYLVLSIILALQSFSALASADTPLEPGLSEKAIIERYGSPDRIVARGGENAFAWYYGNSVIFLRNKAVVAWSNAGELTPRGPLALRRQRPGENKSSYVWENPWTVKESEGEITALRKVISIAPE